MTIDRKQPKPKTCRNAECSIKFVPQRLGQAVCSPACALAIKDVNQQKARKSLAQVERREIKIRKEKLKSRADHLRRGNQGDDRSTEDRGDLAFHKGRDQ